MTGLAGVVELHYATTLQDGDEIAITVGSDYYDLNNQFNRMDVLNLTAGLHAQLGPCSTFRVAAVVPLRSTEHPVLGPTDRAFDSEILMSFNRNF